MVELQDKIANSSINTSEVRDYSLVDGVINPDRGSPKSNSTARERDQKAGETDSTADWCSHFQ